MKKLMLISVVFISFILASYNTNEIKNHIGEYAKVCGKVYDIYYHPNGHLFISIDKKYPNQKMTLIIWDKYKNNFSNINFLNKNICVKGIIKEYKGKIEMFLKTKSQLEIKGK